MSALIEPACGPPSHERVRREAEGVLLRVVTAGRVAEVLLRLLSNQQPMRRTAGDAQDQDGDGALLRRVWRDAGQAIAATVHEQAPQVYYAAVRAACRGGDCDLTGLVLAELAAVHLRLGYAGDCRRLVELAAAGDVPSERTRQVLATVTAWAGEYEQRQRDLNTNFDGEDGSDGDER